MKKYIVLTIINSSIAYSFREITSDEKKFVNKNTINNSSLFYTLNYFKKNVFKIPNIIKKQSFKIDTLVVKQLVTFEYVVNFMRGFDINYLKLDFPSTIGIEDYKMFLSIKSLRLIDCYYMPKFMIDQFIANGVQINLYNFNKVSDRFMLQQDSFDYETLYYRKTLDLKEEYPGLLEDVKEFLRINYNLKSINIYIFSKDIISQVIDLVKNDESRNIIVFLHQEYDKGNFIVSNFAWLKELNKTCKKEYMCEFRIVYSNSFIKNNLFKQLTFNNLKLIASLCIYVSFVSLIIIKSYDYIDKLSVDKLNTDIISNTLNNNDETEDTTIAQAPVEEEEQVPTISEREQMKIQYTFEKVFSNLKKINNETIGYLTINNTEVAYPVVQHDDNVYYLKHDFFQKSKSVGWIFMDYRNNSKSWDDNTIIYGHYSSGNGIMFGSLKNVLSSKWRSNSENMIFSYDTEYKSYKFKIFAGYKIDYTTDYLVTNFEDENEFNDFVKMIRDRSTFNTNDEVKYGDKILTLSTCAGGNNRRMVVHAVMMKEEEE